MSETPSQQFHEYLTQVIELESQWSDQLLASCLVGTHVLFEGPPGTGKTTLARCLGQLMGGMGRIQMTPDLSPSDILGYEAIDPQKQGGLLFHKGPIFHSVLLVDEINRASPRTQSALLEAMEEKIVTVGDQHFELPDPFFVMATQNPLDLDGTFLLPLSQLDRFGCTLRISPPEGEKLEKIISMHLEGVEPPKVLKEASFSLEAFREGWNKIPMHEDCQRIVSGLQNFLLHDQELVERGARPASPRAFLIWLNLAKALSYIRGHEHLSLNALKELLAPVFLHRMEVLDDPTAFLQLLEQRFDRLLGQA